MRTPDEVNAVNSRILEEALALPGPSRARFLNAACSTPSEATRMLSIVMQLDKLGSFLEQPQFQAETTAFLKPGDRLANRFHILKLAGTGGMGEVYCAFDELQELTVALKICRGSWWTNEELLSRLKAEVRLAWRISHRNVCRIHSLFSEPIETRAPLFLTMEWFNGGTLTEFIKEQKAIAPDESLRILAGIAEGLSAIHGAGIIHRDLKPGNIFLVREENGSQRSVITDFGLACDCNSALADSNSGNAPMQLVGTPDYMAPEQFLGEPITPATDVYALGLIAFELLTGVKPFPAENVFKTALQRMKGAPDTSQIPGSRLLASRQHAFDRALAADPTQRYQDPRAFVADLATPTSPRPLETVSRKRFRILADIFASRSAARSRAFSWAAFGLIVAGLIVAIGAIALRLVRRTDLYTVTHTSPITALAGMAQHPCYSPDGRMVTFSLNRGGARHIYVIVPRSDNLLPLTNNPASDDFPMWSPDGKYIAFLRFTNQQAATLMLIPAIGGEERILHSVDLSLETVSSSSYLTWTPDSKWICFTTRPEQSKSHAGLVVISMKTGESHPVFSATDKNTSDSSPAFSPDGHWLAFVRFSSFYLSTIFVQRLLPELQPDGSPIAVSGAGQNPLSPVWTPDGQSLLFLDRSPSRLLQVELSDVTSARPAHEIYVATATLNGLSFAGSEPRLATSTSFGGNDLWSMALKGNSPGARIPRKILASSRAPQFHPEYSPDGSSLAFVSDRDGSHQVWVASPNGDHPRQLTRLDNFILRFPCWSPDGQSIAFHARVLDDAELFVTRSQDGVLRQVTRGGPSMTSPSWSSDGAFLYAFGPHDGSQFLFRITVQSGAREVLWEGTQSQEVPGRHLLLYGKINQRGVFARRLTERGAGEREQKLVEDYGFLGGRGFIPVKNGFYYVASDSSGTPRAFRFYSFESNKAVDLAAAPNNFSMGFTVSPDRSTLIYAATRFDDADLISLELKKVRR